jgi:hypothetical protein
MSSDSSPSRHSTIWDAMQHLSQQLSLAETPLAPHFNMLFPRVVVKNTTNSPPGLIQANLVDPFAKAGKYGLAWVVFGVFFLVMASALYFYHAVTDRIRTAQHEDEVLGYSNTSSPSTDYEMTALKTDKSTSKLFPRADDIESQHIDSKFWTFRPVLVLIACFRFIFYRPAPEIRFRKTWKPTEFPAFSTVMIAFLGVTMSVLYCFIQQPLYWQSMAFGAPPVAVRSGMMAVSLMPWIIAMAMKTNLVSLVTGIGHERLNVLHRWGAYLCLLLSLIHAVPFYVQRLRDRSGYETYKTYFQTGGLPIFASGEYTSSNNHGRRSEYLFTTC